MDQEKEIIKSKGQGVSLSASPAKTLKDAQRAAKGLLDVIKQNKAWAVNISGHEYLVFEAWQTVAQFYGCSVDTSEKPERVQFGEVEGFQASAKVIDKRSGLPIGGATALCMSDETNWRSKPLYQLSSMAQTRAGSKALRNMFSWVVVLAGYKATPAEEMLGTEKQKFSNGNTAKTVQDETKIEPATTAQLGYIDMLVGQGRVENRDYQQISKKEAISLIDRGLKTPMRTYDLKVDPTV